MTVIDLLAFASVLAVTAATPGPQIVAIVAQAMRFGAGPATWMVAGMVLGDVLYLLGVAAGLASVADALAGLLVAVKWLGIVYLGWLAMQFWRAEPPAPSATPAALPGVCDAGGSFLCGLAIVLGNPQSLLFYVSVLPTVTDMAALTPADLGALAAVTAAVFAAVQCFFAAAGLRSRAVLSSPRGVRLMNRAAAFCMSGVAVAMAAW